MDNTNNNDDDDDAFNEFDRQMTSQCEALARWFEHQGMNHEQGLAILAVAIGTNIGGYASSLEHLKEEIRYRFALIEECADDVFHERLRPGSGEIKSIPGPSDKQEEQTFALLDWFESQDISLEMGHMTMAVFASDLIGFDASSREDLERIIRMFRNEVEVVARTMFEDGREAA